MPQCQEDDCLDEVKRRKMCWHCGLYVCYHCWHHLHGCMPGHREEDCRDLVLYKKFGKLWIAKLREPMDYEEAYLYVIESLIDDPCLICTAIATKVGMMVCENRQVCEVCNRSFRNRCSEGAKRKIIEQLEAA